MQAAIEAELTRLLTENGLASHLQTGGAIPSLNTNGIQLTPGSSPKQMGILIAQSVYSGIGSKR